MYWSQRQPDHLFEYAENDRKAHEQALLKVTHAWFGYEKVITLQRESTLPI